MYCERPQVSYTGSTPGWKNDEVAELVIVLNSSRCLLRRSYYLAPNILLRPSKVRSGFIAGRAIVGIAQDIALPASPTYISEITPAQSHHAFLVLSFSCALDTTTNV